MINSLIRPCPQGSREGRIVLVQFNSRGDLENGGRFTVKKYHSAKSVTEDGDNPPVGIILCSDSDSTEVEFGTAGMDQKLFVSRYLVALPSVEKLRNFLESDRERIENLIPPPTARKRAQRRPKA